MNDLKKISIVEECEGKFKRKISRTFTQEEFNNEVKDKNDSCELVEFIKDGEYEVENVFEETVKDSVMYQEDTLKIENVVKKQLNPQNITIKKLTILIDDYFSLLESIENDNCNYLHDVDYNKIDENNIKDINRWMSKIFGTEISCKLTENSFKTSISFYNSEYEFGSSSMASVFDIITLCITNRGSDIMLKYPECCISPKIQSMLGEFFIDVVNNGTNLLIQTNSEHLINRIQYNIFKKNISHEDVIINYLDSLNNKNEHIEFNKNGDFNKEFPSGFFDVSVDMLMEMV